MQGQKIAELVNSRQTKGGYKIHWNASNYPAGTYISAFQLGDNLSSRRQVIRKLQKL